MENFGQPDELKDKVLGGGLKRVKVAEGTNVHRILFGPVKMSMVYYPTLIEDKEEGGFKQALKVLKPAPGTSPLAALASLDKRIRKNQGEETPKSSLDPTNSWLYLVLDKNAENYPTVAVADYKYSIFNKIIELEKTPSLKDPTKLMHGLVFMWDAIITKTVKAGLSKQFGTRYDVTVDPDNPYSGKVPIQYVGMSTADLTERLDKIGGFKSFFTPEEWEAVQKSDLNLEEEGKHDTIEEMQAKLAEFPIFLGAKNGDGSYRFPSVKEFKEQVTKLGLEFFESDKEAPTTRKLSAGKKETEVDFVDEVETEPETEIADAEVVEEIEPEKPVKEPKKPVKEPEKVNAKDTDFPTW